MKTILSLISLYLRLLEVISTKLAVAQAFRLFQKPRGRKMRAQEKAYYDTATPQRISTPDGDVCYYESGVANGPLVVLVHGWESNAGSVAGIGEALALEGFRVVAFDMPAHGNSTEKRANLHTMSNHLQAVLDRIATAAPFSVVAHSFGSIVSAYTLARGSYAVNQLVYLTAPAHMPGIFNEFKRMVRLSDTVYAGIVSTAEALVGEQLANITTEGKTRAISYRNLLLIHDRNDKVLSFSNSETLAAELPNATLHAFEDIGHYRMLWAPALIKLVTNTLATAHQPTPIAAPV